MKKTSIFILIVILLAGCKVEPQFTVEGKITDADGKKIYLEASEIQGVAVLDSIKLNSSGTYKFNYKAPDSPEYYRLRIDNKVINFAVDSTETITINAPYEEFSTAYQVSGSPNTEKIKELVMKQIKLQEDVNNILKSIQGKVFYDRSYEDRVTNLINEYKDEIKREYIFSAPNTTAAYFALFQKVNNFMLFDPLNNKDDLRCFQAVATSLDTYYPHSARSQNIRNLTLKGVRNTRQPQQASAQIQEEMIEEVGIIDIALKDIKGNEHKLTDLKGKVVLLDFTIYQNAASSPHNFALNSLYEEFNEKGFEIYQVSFDADEHYWRTVTGNLPWTCVRDPQGIYSSLISLYSLDQLPEIFIINRDNELIAKDKDIKNLYAVIKKWL